ncbi:hypothetical protein, partial [Vibrio parahaemolyticus]
DPQADLINNASQHEHAVKSYGHTFKKSIFDASGLADINKYDVDTMVSISPNHLEPKQSVHAASLSELKSLLS